MDLFVRNGFEGTSVDDIAAAAGVSKQTVYSHFESKENLYGQAISAKCQEYGMSAEAIDHSVPPAVLLPQVARRFLDLLTSPEAVRVYRITTGNAATHPELGQLFFNSGPVQAVNAVASYLQAQHDRGLLRVPQPRHAAWQLLSMLRAEALMRVQFNLESAPADDTEAYIDGCVAMFLSAYQAQPA
ncbi:MAG: TetR/AcrR family transcriptional regulator [Wenzhouxiangellaceae bacterium]